MHGLWIAIEYNPAYAYRHSYSGLLTWLFGVFNNVLVACPVDVSHCCSYWLPCV